jgi:hypothetical protein|mmetsp:Transcript_115592/g.181862  ORF Transcript_115592/g.181862 Transcript_115592/m.181862 type:complete len:535 (+) Transcript_115592:50-1654(+)
MATRTAGEIAAVGQVNLLQGYKRHIVSDFHKDRYPYLEDINGHLKKDEVSMAFGDRLFPRLMEQLMTPDMHPTKLTEALSVICDLCPHQENKVTAVASDVVAAATNLLMHDSVEVRREAARVIGSVAQMVGGRCEMPTGNAKMSHKLKIASPVKPATLPRLANLLLQCDDEIVKKNVAEAFCSMTVFRDGCQQVVDQGSVNDIALYLCYTLPDVPATSNLALCLLNLLQTLAAVTMYANGGMRDIWGTGLIGKVIAFLGKLDGIPALRPADSTETTRQALRMLWHIGNDPTGRKEMLKADGVRVITMYLGSQHDAKVREAAICALNVISLETNGKMEVLKHSTESFARLLHSDQETAYLHETCVQLCRASSELPAFRFAFARHVLKSIWLLEKVFGTTSLSAVSPLLDSKEDLEVRTQAAHVISYFLRSPTPSAGDEIRCPPVCPLSMIYEPAMYAMEECVSIIPNLVSLLDLAREPAVECLEALTDAEKPRKELLELVAESRVKVSEEMLPEIQRMLDKIGDKRVQRVEAIVR